MLIIINYSAAERVRLKDIISPSVKERLKLQLIQGRKFKKIEIEKNCELREAIEYDPKKLKFMQGHAYYEFKHAKENISEDKELIFMSKVH